MQRALSAALAIAFALAGQAFAAPLRVLDLYDEPVVIVRRLYDALAEGKPQDALKMPFVHRLRAAFARADIANDPLTGSGEPKISDMRVLPTKMESATTAEVIVHLKDGATPRDITILLDRTSGEWLITDIRYGNGESLRQMLHIPASR